MQLCAFAPQFIASFDPDFHMLGNRAFVKTVGLTGQFELSVERLVADAQQRAIRDAESVTLRGDSC